MRRIFRYQELSDKYDGRLFNYGEPIDWKEFGAEIRDYIEAYKTQGERDIEAYEQAIVEYDEKRDVLYAQGRDAEADTMPMPMPPAAVLRMEAARKAQIKE